MSAPDTDPEKQVKRHRPSLIGMGVVVVLALAMLLALITFVADRGGVPEGAEEQVDGRTGDIVEQ